MNRPTSIEILQALAQHLETVVQPRLAGAEAYQNRVALNLVHVLERELTLVGVLAEEERAGLRELTLVGAVAEGERLRARAGDTNDRRTLNERLCAMIAAGALSAGDPDLMDHLRRTACAKLAIDNPHYPTYLRLLERRGAPE
jgi:hypothetical protein